jgi:hypothetical protein
MTVKNFEVSTGRNYKDLEKQVSSMHSSINICLIVLPGNMKNDYKRIKKSAINEEMVTQVITEITIRKKNIQSIATKVLLQIIAKRGNILWVPETAHTVKNCMLLGFDTAKSASKTVMSATATLNSTFTSLYTRHKVYDQSEGKFKAMFDLTLECV